MKKRSRTSYPLGYSGTSLFGLSYTVIDYPDDPHKRTIKCSDGTIRCLLISTIKKGKMKSKMDATIVNVGLIGSYSGVASNHPLYFRWANMLRRCYDSKSPNYNFYGGKGVTVEEYLRNFTNYVSFVSSLPNYEELIANPSEWQIDKDEKGKNIYSRDTIQIVPSKVNLEIENVSKRYPVYRKLENGELEFFESITTAEKETGIHKGNIARSVRTHFKAGGYKWGRAYEQDLFTNRAKR